MEDEETSSDAIVISDDKDPLESDDDASNPALGKPVTLSSFSMDFVEGDAVLPVRMTRKRSAQQSATSLAVEAIAGKKLKLKVIEEAFLI